ncbi:hypothetical protein ANO11243_060240 [Dothideomycetidae sp. 11243]|nr:hypothetical protein ANO11243_060240 [fungal sp. No.11243]
MVHSREKLLRSSPGQQPKEGKEQRPSVSVWWPESGGGQWRAGSRAVGSSTSDGKLRAMALGNFQDSLSPGPPPNH